MKIIFRLAMLLFLFPIICNGQNLLNAPQKIVVDKKPGRVGFVRNRLLVSNFNGGSIVEIDTAGNQSYFLASAGFVDGMEIVGNRIYGVGNNRKVFGYELDSKYQIMNLTMEGAPADYLSSMAYDSLGHLFISCPNLNAIYRLRLSDNSYWIFAQNNGLNRPNGILLEKEKNRIVVIDDSPGSSLIHAISLEDSTVTTLASTSFDRPDGIVRDKYGYYYIGGYYLPGLYTTDSDFSYHPQLFFAGQNMVYPTYDPYDHSLLITYYGTNSWERIQLTTTASNLQDPFGEIILHPVYPNPTKSGMTIRYELNKGARVRLEAFNSTGMRISTLLDKEMEAGVHSAFWNGCNDKGCKMPKGVYFIRTDIDGATHTQKVVLID